jgi:hypothetical protein
MMNHTRPDRCAPDAFKQAGAVTDDLGYLADALEADMNHYLTVTDREYYPDTNRMFMQGYGGSGFKKVYRDRFGEDLFPCGGCCRYHRVR